MAKRIRMLTGVEKTPEQMEAAAMVQQMQIAEAQLELEKMQAEVQRINSEAAVNVAAQAQPLGRIFRLQNCKARSR